MTFKAKREYRQSLFGRAVPELSNWESFTTEAVAPRLWAAVKADTEDGVPFAEEVMDDIGREGSRKVLADAKKHAAKATLIVEHPGGHHEKRDNQAYRGTPRVGPDGQSYFQQSIWWEMGYDEFVALFAAVMRLLAGAAEKAAAFQLVMEAYNAHRNAVNAAEACRLAGIDPREIEITDADIRRARGA